MLVDAVVKSDMPSGASTFDTTLLPVVQSRDSRAVSHTTSCLSLVPPHVPFVYSTKLQLLLTIFMDLCIFHWPSQTSFLTIAVSLLSQHLLSFGAETSVWCLSLSCGNETTSTFMTQRVTAVLLQKSFLKTRYSVVDLNSNLYHSAFTREVHRGKRGQTNCALGHVLGYISLLDGSLVVMGNAFIVLFCIQLYILLVSKVWRVMAFFPSPQELEGSRYKNERNAVSGIHF